MKNEATHITVILDRTGSMEPIREDTIGGFNAFIKAQQDEPGDATLSLVQFDSHDPFEVVHSFLEISTVPKLTHETYVPRAATPLLDAMGRGINDLDHNLSEMVAKNRPGKIVMVIVTDGHENASREFRKDQIEKMIREKEAEMDWQFVFLSSDLDGINDAMESGFTHGKSMRFNKSAAGTTAMFCSVSEKISDYRSSRANEVSFDAEDRSKQGD